MYLVSPNFSDVLEPGIEMKAFPDGDTYIRIPDVSKYQGEEVNLFHRLYPEQNTSMFQAILMLDTLKRVGARTTLVSPYLPYSRQDKTFKEGEALSAQVLCGLLANAGAQRLVTIDCHFLKKEGDAEYGGLNITSLSANKLLLGQARKMAGSDELEVISPDMGASYLVEQFGGKSMSKVRGGYEEGKEAYRKIEGVERKFEVEGKNILILDDMISTGGTMIRAVENVKNGGAKKVYCAATHGFFLRESYGKLKDICDGMFVTNSIPCEAADVDIMELLKEYVD
ncbi:MAG: ribose-phosphate diphosphokinase [Candidatus Micrarchaeota archaeon]